MVAILNQKWPPKHKNPPIWAKFGFQHDRVKNWALIISCYVHTLFFIHTTSTCSVRLGDICNALRNAERYKCPLTNIFHIEFQFLLITNIVYFFLQWGHHGCDCMVVGFTATCSISAYHY
jgi:hypothetical protein